VCLSGYEGTLGKIDKLLFPLKNLLNSLLMAVSLSPSLISQRKRSPGRWHDSAISASKVFQIYRFLSASLSKIS
jgi:hypothetical protein